MLGIIVLLVVLGAVAISGFRVVYQFESCVVFTFGKYSSIRGAGLTWIIPLGIQTIQKIDMRIRVLDVSKQEVITKDNISVIVNAVVYYKVINAYDALIRIQNVNYSVSQYTQAALRDIMGNHELDFVLSERIKVGGDIKQIVEQEISGWGIEIHSIKLQEIEIPKDLQRAIAKQAEAEREGRAMKIVAEAERNAAENLSLAAQMLAKEPAAISLRTLQTIRDISTSPSQKTVIFFPTEFGKITPIIQDLINKA